MKNDFFAAAEGLCQSLHHGIHPLLVSSRHPLKGGKRLRHKRVDTERQCAAASFLIHIISQTLREINDRVDVSILLERQPHHNIQFEIRDMCSRAEINSGKEMMLFNPLIDDGTHPRTPCLRRKG